MVISEDSNSAMGAAVMMMASMSVVGAGASNFNLHYTQGAPSSSVVLSQSFAKDGTVTVEGQITTTTNVTSYNATGVTSNGYVLNGSTYYCVTSFTQTSTGKRVKTGTYYKATKGSRTKSIVKMTYGTKKMLRVLELFLKNKITKNVWVVAILPKRFCY